MSIFYRLCPMDSHTCIEPKCLAGTRSDMLCPANPPEPDKKLPSQTDQAWWDRHYGGDWG